MRASEFLIEKSVFDKIGDAANKQVLGRRALDKAKVRKKNVPGISDALHKILVAQASKLSGSPEEMKKMVTDTLSKSLKVDVTKNPDQFGDSVEKLVNVMTYRADDADAVGALLQDVVDKSFDVKDTNVTTDAEEIARAVVKSVKQGLELQKSLQTEMKKAGYDSDETPVLIEKIADVLEKDAKKDVYKAIVTVLERARPGDVANVATDEVPGGSEKAAEPEPEAPPATTTSTGIPIADLKEQLKAYLLKEPEFQSGNMENDSLAAAEQIAKSLEDNGMSPDDPQFDKISDELLADEDMPWNYEHPEQFRAQVYAPDGWRGDRIVYAWHDGKWHQYQVASAKSWIYLSTITDPQEVASIRSLIKSGSGSRKLRNFRHDREGFYTVTDK